MLVAYYVLHAGGVIVKKMDLVQPSKKLLSNEKDRFSQTSV